MITDETSTVVKHGTDTVNRFGDNIRRNPEAIAGARDGLRSLRTRGDEMRGEAARHTSTLAGSSSGATTDRATMTANQLEKEVEDILSESAQIEDAVAEAAETLDVGEIENDRIRDEIIRDINKTMKAVAALRAQPDGQGEADARALLTALMERVARKTGESADNAKKTITTLTAIADGMNGGTRASSTPDDTQVAKSFNTGGSGSGGSGGGGYSGGGGGATASKPRLPAAIPPQPGTGVEINLPDGSTVEAPNETAAKAVRAALNNLGVPYVWGGTSPGVGLDCSGLTMTSYGEAGLEIPRHSSAQAIGAEVPSADDLVPGDLIVWDGHVAMYIGNGQLVEAGDPVQVGPLRTTNSGMAFMGFYRPTG